MKQKKHNPRIAQAAYKPYTPKRLVNVAIDNSYRAGTL